MAARIGWSSFPNLSEDQISVTIVPRADPSITQFILVVGPGVTWWKELKLYDAGNNVLGEVSNSDHGSGPYILPVRTSDLSGAVLVISKAKALGIHTGVYEIRDLASVAGRDVTFTWIADDLGSFLTDVTNGIVDLVNTVVDAVTDTVDTVVGAVGDAVGTLIELILSIPYIGRFIAELVAAIQTLVIGLVSAVVDGVLWIVGGMPEKRMKLLVIIQRDETGAPVADVEKVKTALEFAITTFKQQANVRIMPLAPFQYGSPFSKLPDATDAFIVVADANGGAATLDVSCNAAGWGEDFGEAGSQFELMMSNYGFWGNGRRVAGYGAPLCVFAVRSFKGGGFNGCSMGPLTDYVTVEFKTPGDAVLSRLAHELGHACNLTHFNGAGTNLMNPNEPHAPVLTAWQAFVVRASRHVTFT